MPMSDIHERAKQEKTLQEQVEHILEEDCSDTLQVVVRMASPEDARETLVAIASDRAQKRSMALSSRDVLPDPRPRVERLEQTGGRGTRTYSEGFTARVAAARIVGPESTGCPPAKRRSFPRTFDKIGRSEEECSKNILDIQSRTTRGDQR